MQNNPPGAEPGLGGSRSAAPWTAHGRVSGAAWAGVGPAAGEGATAVGFAWAPGCCAAAAGHLSCAESKAVCTAPF